MLNSNQVKQAVDNAVHQILTYLPQFTDQFQCDNSENNFYVPSENVSWTTGFWTGEIWLAYEHTNDERLKNAANIQVESFLNRIENKIAVNHHDMGFLYSLSCVSAYKLTGNENAKKAAILAADHLITRYNEKSKFIQAWGNVGDKNNNRLIIDCLLNLPLLYWATEVTGNSKYADIAKNHIMTSLQYIMREDKSTYHTYFFDVHTGKPLYGATHQGNRNGSAWARGQAWGIYGVALSYRYTKNSEYIKIFKDITDYFIEHLPKDYVPFWDFDFTDGSTEPRDSSAAAIAVCGMLEMVKYMTQADATYYNEKAHLILQSLIDHYSVKDTSISNGLLLHGTYARSSKENTCSNRGVDECTTWGDYFYFEALTRLSKDWQLYW